MGSEINALFPKGMGEREGNALFIKGRTEKKMGVLCPEERAAAQLLPLLPPRIAAELCALAGGRQGFLGRIEELRLRAEGKCSVVIFGRQSPLHAEISSEEMQALVLRLCGGSLYAYEECIAEGYIPLENGMRVGICGRARYEGALLRGVCELRSLVFRFPHTAEGSLAEAAETAFLQAERGLLILSPPGVGKTTALRALALRLGTGAVPRRVVVVDERLEFMPEEYRGATVDLLRGYHRVRALQIAHRCLSPEVVMMDEIGGAEEAEEMAALLRGGAAAVATAHAGSFADLYARPALRPFMRAGIFDMLLQIKRGENGLFFEMKKNEEGEEERSVCFAI